MVLLCPYTCFRVGRKYNLLAPSTLKNSFMLYPCLCGGADTLMMSHYRTYSPPHIMLTVIIILCGVEVFSSHCLLSSSYIPLWLSRLVVFSVCRMVPTTIWLLTCKDNKFRVVLGIGTHPEPCSYRYYTHYLLTQSITVC